MIGLPEHGTGSASLLFQERKRQVENGEFLPLSIADGGKGTSAERSQIAETQVRMIHHITVADLHASGIIRRGFDDHFIRGGNQRFPASLF